MIFTSRTIKVNRGKSSIDEPIILYRGDFEVEVRFTILESNYRFKSGVNLIDSEKAAHAQLALLAPDGTNVITEIGRCEDGTAIFTLNKDMIDELSEVGLYSFQIRLFDYYRESRVTIPPIEFGIEVREPIASEDHINTIDQAMVGYSIAKTSVLDEPVPDTFDADGQYNKTDWVTGDRVSEGKLNKIEDAIDKINQNELSHKEALNKQMVSNFNVLQAQIDNLQSIDGKIYINPIDFGVIGDGVTDNTQAIKSMCEFVNNRGYGYIVFPKGTYRVSIEDRSDYWFNNRATVAHFSKCGNVNIDLGGSTFIIDSNRSPFYSIFSFGECEYFEIKNGNLIGDRMTHDYAEYRGLKTHEWGYGIEDIGSNGRVLNMEISNFTGDGIISGSSYSQSADSIYVRSKSYIEVDDCKIHHCRRQGITIGEGYGGCIRNTNIHHIGDWDGVTGTDPKSGIDLEFELAENRCDSVIIDNVTISDCSNFCIVSAVSGHVLENFLLANSNIDGRIALSTAKTGVVSNTTINFKTANGIPSCSYLRFDDCKIHLDTLIYLREVTFNNCHITGNYVNDTDSSSSIQCETNVTFNSCTIEDIRGSARSYNWPSGLVGKPLIGFNTYSFEADYIFNHCIISNCSAIMKASYTKLFKVFNSTVKNCYFMTLDTTTPRIQYVNCNIENLCGYYVHEAKYLFKNCSIKDDGTMPVSFVGTGLAMLYNCNAEITKTSNKVYNYYVEAYNSYLNYDSPSDSAFDVVKLYNCCFISNNPEISFGGVKENTTYITK